MQPLLTLAVAQATQQEFLDRASRWRTTHASRRTRKPRAPALLWQGLTLRLATSADGPALERLAQLEQAAAPAQPVLLGVVMQRPVAALSLTDGTVVADPFTPTCELVELLRLRARQLSRA